MKDWGPTAFTIQLCIVAVVSLPMGVFLAISGTGAERLGGIALCLIGVIVGVGTYMLVKDTSRE